MMNDRPPRPAPSHQSLQKRCVSHRETMPHHTQQSPDARCRSEGASRSPLPTPARFERLQRRCSCHRETTPHSRQGPDARCRSEAGSRSQPARPAPSGQRSRRRCVCHRGTTPHLRQGLYARHRCREVFGPEDVFGLAWLLLGGEDGREKRLLPLAPAQPCSRSRLVASFYAALFVGAAYLLEGRRLHRGWE